MGLPSLAGVEALVHIHPVVRGLPIASFHCRVGFAPALCLAAALLDGTAKCPESLCPMSVFPHWGDVYAVSCEDITPRSSLLRTLALLSFGLSLVQEVSAGCFQPPAATGIFPTLSLRIFPRMLGPLPRRSHGVRIPVSSSVSSAFPQRGLGRLPASIREYDFSRGCFRGCTQNALGRGLSLYPHTTTRFHYDVVAVIVQLYPPTRPVTDPPIRTIPVDIWAIRRR